MVVRPWMDAVEAQAVMLRALLFAKQDHRYPERDWYVEFILRQLQLADPYWWSETPTHAVLAAARTQSGAEVLQQTDLPADGRAGWWWLGPNKPLPFVALGWSSATMLPGTTDNADFDGIGLTMFVRLRDLEPDTPDLSANEPWPLQTIRWPFGMSITEVLSRAQDDLQHEKAVAALGLRFFLAACVWLRERIYLTLTVAPIERHRRKQFAREQHMEVQDVKLVELRRRESRRPDGGSSAVDWHWQWVVSGHWRVQPTKEGRKTVYIGPYVKGPENKPMKPILPTVYLVRR